MPVAIKLPDKVKDDIVALTKRDNVVEGIIDLVKQEFIRKKTKYLFMVKNFEKKYGMTFRKFEKKNKNRKIDYETEKDYFDWDMALTALDDIEDEFKGA
jgi:hypothetical protein